MDYEKDLKSVGNIGVDVDYTPPKITTPYQEGISQKSKISYKEGIAFKPKFVQFTISGQEFWAPADFNINPN